MGDGPLLVSCYYFKVIEVPSNAHSFSATLAFVVPSSAKASKRNQKSLWIFYLKTPAMYQWTTEGLIIENNRVKG
jgi:hypothetical protein